MDEARTIAFKLADGFGYFQRLCHVCGAVTETTMVLVTTGDGLRMCETCLEERDFDDRLRNFALRLERQAAQTRAMIDRIEAPSFAAWKRAMADFDAECEREERAAGHGDQVDEIEAVTIDDLRARYVDQSNWRRNEQGFPYIELFGRVIAIYPVSADDWTWMIYRGGPEPLAWLADPDRLHGVGMGESDARDEAWKAFQADLEKLEGPILDDWF